MSIEEEIDTAAAYLLDVAPVERAYLEDVLMDMLKTTGNVELMRAVDWAALAYAHAAADRAYALGLELGKEAKTIALRGKSG